VGDDASAAGLAHMRLHTPAEPKDWGSDKVESSLWGSERVVWFLRQRGGVATLITSLPLGGWWCKAIII